MTLHLVLTVLQVDIPDAARNALEALKAKRLQKAQQSSAPLEDTLPSSSQSINDTSPSQQSQDRPLSVERGVNSMQMEAQADPMLMTDTLGLSGGQALSNSNAQADAAPANDTLHTATEADPVPVADTLDQSCDHALSVPNAQGDAAPMDDTLPGSEPVVHKAAAAAAAQHDGPVLAESESNTEAAPATDTLDASTTNSMSWRGQDANDSAADENDDVLIREAMASAEQAGGSSNRDQNDANDADNDALLQSLLAEGE